MKGEGRKRRGGERGGGGSVCDWPNNDRLTIFDSAYETTNFYYHYYYYMCCFCSHYYGQLNREHTVDDVRSLFRSMQ